MIWVGALARDFQHFGLFGIFEVGNNLRFGYTFEMPSNSLVQGNYGTHELSLAIDLELIGDHLLSDRQF